jgi:hypothetical protein
MNELEAVGGIGYLSFLLDCVPPDAEAKDISVGVEVTYAGDSEERDHSSMTTDNMLTGPSRNFHETSRMHRVRELEGRTWLS